MVSLNLYDIMQIRDAKFGGKKIGFKLKCEIESHAESSPKSVGILTGLRCISGSNLEILTSFGDDLFSGQAQNGVNFDF